MGRTISIVTGWEEGKNYRRVGIQWWRLLKDAVFKMRESDGRTQTIRIPSAYQWNGASVPWAAHWYAQPEHHLMESLPHDWCYQFHWVWMLNEVTGEWKKTPVSKRWTDALFHDLLRLRGVRVTKTDVLWAAVRFGGWLAWWNNTCNGDCTLCPCNAGAWCTERKDAK